MRDARHCCIVARNSRAAAALARHCAFDADHCSAPDECYTDTRRLLHFFNFSIRSTTTSARQSLDSTSPRDPKGGGTRSVPVPSAHARRYCLKNSRHTGLLGMKCPAMRCPQRGVQIRRGEVERTPEVELDARALVRRPPPESAMFLSREESARR